MLTLKPSQGVTIGALRLRLVEQIAHYEKFLFINSW